MRRVWLATLVVGVVDLADAVVFWWLRAGVPPIRIFHSIAAGLLGRDGARAGGWGTALLGIGLHFVIAFGVVSTYALAARRIPALLRHPWLLGPLYGVVVYLVMTFVVLPLSAFGGGGALPEEPPVLVNALLIHMLGVGLPTTLILSSRR
jgi:hypothetical protein